LNATSRIVFLMYHELELPGRKLCQSEPGYVRYILAIDAFHKQLQWLRDSGFRGLNVSEALSYPAERSVSITFDDGCETDLIAAAPLLREFGFHATFYVTAGFLDTPGYLSSHQLRELNSREFEIGCHSMTHPYLSDLSDSDLNREIADAKTHIESVLSHPIEHFSCPGGRYNERVLSIAKQAGFKSVANSDFHVNTAASSVYELGRIAVLRDMSLDQFGATCRGHGLWKKRLQHTTSRVIQRTLGNRTYDQLRATLLGESH
jgi:peptidoglycan/xylan/chitin deacetylase (PgdA/CDA1 family)